MGEQKPNWIIEHAVKVVVGAILLGAIGWFGSHFLPSTDVAAKLDPIEVIENATPRLYARADEGEFDLGERIAGIQQLRLLANRKVETRYREQAIGLLAAYVKQNLPERKRDAPALGITEDRGMFSSQDIGDALRALQELRMTDPARLAVDLTRGDFSRMDLAYLDLSGFSLRFADFSNGAIGPLLRDVDFSFAVFRNTAIWNADLSGSRFHKSQVAGIKLMNPIVTNTSLEEAFGLDQMGIFCNPRGLSELQQSRTPIRCPP
jgi:hypothetical protein